MVSDKKKLIPIFKSLVTRKFWTKSMFQFSLTKPVLIGMKPKTFSSTKNNTFALVMNKVVWMLVKEILVVHSVSFSAHNDTCNMFFA